MNIQSGHILDLGTGLGTQAIALAKMDFRVTAIYISATAIEKARTKSAQQGVNIDLWQDNVLDTKLEDKFDYISDRGCFHVFPPENRDEYIKFIASHLASGGSYFLKCFSYKEKGPEPYRFTHNQTREYFASRFAIISIAKTVYQGTGDLLPKALFCVMKKHDAR